MFTKVMVGIDGTAGGRDALALAEQLVAPDGELIAANVHGFRPSKLAPLASGAEDIAVEKPDTSGIELPAGTRVCTTVASGTGRGLHYLAEREGADLLVVGSSSHGILGRVLMGDVTTEAINGAPCAVAVAPTGYAEHPGGLQRIGIAYNDSEESENALSVGRAIAQAHHGRLSAMEVVNFPTYAYLDGAGLTTVELTQPMMDDARARLQALGDVEPHTAFGLAAEELTEFSAGTDLLIVGSRGYGPVGRVVHGSVSRHLAHSCRCPLLILTKAAQAQEEFTA